MIPIKKGLKNRLRSIFAGKFYACRQDRSASLLLLSFILFANLNASGSDSKINNIALVWLVKHQWSDPAEKTGEIFPTAIKGRIYVIAKAVSLGTDESMWNHLRDPVDSGEIKSNTIVFNEIVYGLDGIYTAIRASDGIVAYCAASGENLILITYSTLNAQNYTLTTYVKDQLTDQVQIGFPALYTELSATPVERAKVLLKDNQWPDGKIVRDFPSELQGMISAKEEAFVLSYISGAATEYYKERKPRDHGEIRNHLIVFDGEEYGGDGILASSKPNLRTGENSIVFYVGSHDKKFLEITYSKSAEGKIGTAYFINQYEAHGLHIAHVGRLEILFPRN